MKPSAESVRDTIEQAGEVGIDLPVDQAELLLRHMEWVLSANERVNLTAIRDRDEAVRLHVVDSLVALPEILEAPGGALLDIGTGGGFPGFALAVCSGRDATLLDSVKKKVAVLEEFLESEALTDTIKATAGRAEELAATRTGGFSVVVARAVAELPALIELARPLLRSSGRFVALKARLSDDEAARGDVVAGKVGMRRVGSRRVVLPGGAETREIVTYEVCGRSAVKLPRRTGLAQSRPLA